MKLPTVYQKFLDLVKQRDDGIGHIETDAMQQDLARAFRLSKQDVREMFKELDKKYGVLKWDEKKKDIMLKRS